MSNATDSLGIASPPDSNPRQSRRQWLRRAFSLAPAAIAGGTAADAFWIGPHRLNIRHRKVTGVDTPMKWVQFSDVHFKGDEEYFHRTIQRIADLKPDFAVFTGDLIEEAQFLEPACEILSKLPVPLFAIPGNHDHWANVDLAPLAKACRKTGGEWLQDRGVPAPKGNVHLIGYDRGTDTVNKAEGKFNVALVHYPAWANGLTFQADLILAGHTHGGQVRIPFFGAVVLPHATEGYDMGAFSTRCGPLYVNPGIGTFYLNVRFRCPPELTVFES